MVVHPRPGLGLTPQTSLRTDPTRAQESQARVQCQARVRAVPCYRSCDFGQVVFPHCRCFKSLQITAFYAKWWSPFQEAGTLRVTLKCTGSGRGLRACRSTKTTVTNLRWRQRGALGEPGRPSTIALSTQVRSYSW